MSGHEKCAVLADWQRDQRPPTTTREDKEGEEGETRSRRRRRRVGPTTTRKIRGAKIEIPNHEKASTQWEQSETSRASGKLVESARRITWNHQQHDIISTKSLKLAHRTRTTRSRVGRMAADRQRPIKKSRLKLSWLVLTKDTRKYSVLVPILALVLIGATCVWSLGSNANEEENNYNDDRQLVRKQQAVDSIDRQPEHLRTTTATNIHQQLQSAAASASKISNNDTSAASNRTQVITKLLRSKKQHKKESSPNDLDHHNSIGKNNDSATQRRRSAGKQRSDHNNSKQTRDAHQNQQQTGERFSQEAATIDASQNGFDSIGPQLRAYVSDSLQPQQQARALAANKAQHEQQQLNEATSFPEIIPNNIEAPNLNQAAHHQHSQQQQQLPLSIASNRPISGGNKVRSSAGHELSGLLSADERHNTLDGGETSSGSDFMTAIPLGKQHSASIKVVFNNNPQFIIGRGERNNKLDLERQQQFLLRKLSRSGRPFDGPSPTAGDLYHPDESHLAETRVELGQSSQQQQSVAFLNQSASTVDHSNKGGLPCSEDRHKHHHHHQLNVEQIDLTGQEPLPVPSPPPQERPVTKQARPPETAPLPPPSPLPPHPPRAGKTKTRPPPPRQSMVPIEEQQQQQEVDTPFEQIVKSGLRPPLRMVVSMRNKEGDMMKVPINLHGSSSRQPDEAVASDSFDLAPLSPPSRASMGQATANGGGIEAHFEQHSQAPELPRLQPKPVDENTPIGGDFFDPSLVRPFPRKSAPNFPGKTGHIEPPPAPRAQKQPPTQQQHEEEIIVPEKVTPQLAFPAPPTRRPPVGKTAPPVKRPDCHEAPRLPPPPQPPSTTTTTTTPPLPEQQQQEEEPQQQQQQQQHQEHEGADDDAQKNSSPMTIGSSQEVVQMMVPKLTEFRNKTFASMFVQFQKALNEQMQNRQQQQQQEQNDEQEDLMVAMLAANLTGRAEPRQEIREVSMTVIKPPKGTSLEEAIRVHTQQQANTGASVAILQSNQSKPHKKKQPVMMDNNFFDNSRSSLLPEAGPVPVDIHLRHVQPSSSGSIVPDSESEFEIGNPDDDDDDGFSSGSELVGNAIPRRQQHQGGRRRQQQHGGSQLALARYKRSPPMMTIVGASNGTNLRSNSSDSNNGGQTIQKRMGGDLAHSPRNHHQSTHDKREQQRNSNKFSREVGPQHAKGSSPSSHRSSSPPTNQRKQPMVGAGNKEGASRSSGAKRTRQNEGNTKGAERKAEEAIVAAASENSNSRQNEGDADPDADDDEPEEDAEPSDSNESPAASSGDDFPDGNDLSSVESDSDSDDSSGLFDSDDEPFNQGASSERDYHSPSSFEIPKIDINPNTLRQKGCRTVLREVQEIPMNGLGAVQANGEAGSGYSSSSSRSAGHNRVKRQLSRGANNDNLINSRKVTSIVMTKECHFPNEFGSDSQPNAVAIAADGHKRSTNKGIDLKSARTKPEAASRPQYSAAPSHLVPAISKEPGQSDRKPLLAVKKHLATSSSVPHSNQLRQQQLQRQQHQQLVNLFNSRLAQNNLRQQQLVKQVVKPSVVGPAGGGRILALPVGQSRQFLTSSLPIGAQVQIHKLLQAQQGPAQLIRRRAVPTSSAGPSIVKIESAALANGQRMHTKQLATAAPQPVSAPSGSPQARVGGSSGPRTHHDRHWPPRAQPVKLNDRDFYVGADSRRNEVVAQKLYKPPSADDPFHTLSYSSKNGNDPDMEDDEDDRIVAEPEELEGPRKRLAARVSASNGGQFEQREAPTERERKALMDPNYDDTDPMPAQKPRRGGNGGAGNNNNNRRRKGNRSDHLVDSILDDELGKGDGADDGDDRPLSSSSSSTKLARPNSDDDEGDADLTDESRPAPSEKRRAPHSASSAGTTTTAAPEGKIHQSLSKQQPMAGRNFVDRNTKTPGSPKARPQGSAPIHRSIIHDGSGDSQPARAGGRRAPTGLRGGEDYDEDDGELRFGKSFKFEHQIGRPESRGLMGQLRDLKPGGQGFVRVESDRAKTTAAAAGGKLTPNNNKGSARSGSERSKVSADLNDASSNNDDDDDGDDVSQAADESASKSAIRRNNHQQQHQQQRQQLSGGRRHQPQHLKRREDEDLDEQDEGDEDNEVPASGNYGARAQASRESSAPTRSHASGRSGNNEADAASEEDPDSDPDYNAKEGQLPANSKPKRVQKSFAYVHRDLPRDGSKNSDDFVVSYGRGNLQTEHEDYDSDRDNNRLPEDRAASEPRRSFALASGGPISAEKQAISLRRAGEAPKFLENLVPIGGQTNRRQASSSSRNNNSSPNNHQQHLMRQRRWPGQQQNANQDTSERSANKSVWTHQPSANKFEWQPEGRQ